MASKYNNRGTEGRIHGIMRTPFAHTESASIFSISLLVVEIILGLAGNLRLLVLVVRQKSRKKVSQWLVLSLCSTGVILCGIGLPLFLVSFTLHYLQDLKLSRAVCLLRDGILVYSFFANSLIICALSVVRYESILRPFKKRITVNNVKKYIKVISIISLILGIVPIVDINSEACVLVLFRIDSVLSFIVLSLAGTTAVAISTMIILTYFHGIRSMRKISDRLQQTTSDTMLPNVAKRNNKESKVTRLVLKIIFFYLLSWLPTTLWYQIARYVSLDSATASDTELCLFVVSFTTYVTNPFIYMRNSFSKLRKVDSRLSGRPGRRACNGRRSSVFVVENELSRVNVESI